MTVIDRALLVENNVILCIFKEFIMTKADWLDFFEAINGRSATEEEIAVALAAGEFQDDAPAVEAAPVQEAPAQPIFAGA